MGAVSVGSRSGSRILGRELWCCGECYTAQHYGAEFVSRHAAEWGTSWDLDTYSETVNSLAENGAELSDWTCPEHVAENGAECVYCGSAESETGLREFSKASCELCGSLLSGERFRFAVWEPIGADQ